MNTTEASFENIMENIMVSEDTPHFNDWRTNLFRIISNFNCDSDMAMQRVVQHDMW